MRYIIDEYSPKCYTVNTGETNMQNEINLEDIHGQDQDAQKVVFAPVEYLLQDGDMRHIMLRGFNSFAMGVN